MYLYLIIYLFYFFFFFQAEDGIRDDLVTGVQTCALPICQSVRIVDLAKKMIKLSGLELGKDIQIQFTGLRPGEKLYEELLADKENTIPTHHPQIMVAKVREYDQQDVTEQIEGLTALYDDQNNEALVRALKAMVPEYISKNSEYSKLDQGS